MKKSLLAIVLVAGLALSACSNALLSSGTALDAVYKDYRSASLAFASGCNASPRSIPDSACDSFKKFQVEFERDFPLAVSAWELAAQVGDPTSVKTAKQRVEDLVSRLAVFTVQLANGFKGVK